MIEQIVIDWRKRPWWMNLLFYFCLYMTFIYMPFDIFVKWFTQAPSEWEEIWFGYTLTAWPAKATEPLHWFIYAAGAYGFYGMRSYMWPWAFIYTLQVVIAMVVFNLSNEKGAGINGAMISGFIFALPAWMLYRHKRLFEVSDLPPAG